MQYREIKKLNTKISTFGMGCMRLPLAGDANGNVTRIDESQALKMIHYAIDHGVNYLDTAYVYHGEQSEAMLGKALCQEDYRRRVLVATKFPSYLMAIQRYEELQADPPGVVERLVDEELRRLQTDHIDIYLLHNMGRKRWPALQAVGILDVLERLRAKGKLRFLGFSFHDSYNWFTKIIDAYDWDMCQIQLNILDQDFQAGVAGLKYAGSKGIPVAIMEPLRGGSLAQNIPAEIQTLWDSYGPQRSAVEWCFRWLCNFPEVMTILSGVSTLEQTTQNVRLFDELLPNSLSQAELELVDKVREQYQRRIRVSCTNCGYCQPCPAGVKIPEVFRIYNNACMFNNLARGRTEYAELAAGQAGDPVHCVGCGKCESHCPQNIAVMERLREAAAFLG